MVDNADVVKAIKTISKKENSLVRAKTLKSIDVAHAARKKAANVIRPFEASNTRRKELFTQRLRTIRPWDVLCARERSYVVPAHSEKTRNN
jgi:hypothetical protein